jgi:hypothetical protein
MCGVCGWLAQCVCVWGWVGGGCLDVWTWTTYYQSLTPDTMMSALHSLTNVGLSCHKLSRNDTDMQRHSLGCFENEGEVARAYVRASRAPFVCYTRTWS